MAVVVLTELTIHELTVHLYQKRLCQSQKYMINA